MSQYNIAISGLLNVLQSYGFISEAERGLLAATQEFEGERINIISSAELPNITDIGLIIEKSLDRKVDAIVASSSVAAQSAVHATSDMDDPPAVIFTRVSDPYAAGIAQSSCVKPNHVTGLQTAVPYEEIIPLLLAQDPDIKSIGMIHTSSDPGRDLWRVQNCRHCHRTGTDGRKRRRRGDSGFAPSCSGLSEQGGGSHYPAG